MVVPLFNLMMDELEEMDLGGDSVMERTRDAILAKLREYYAKTDSSRLYIIALSENSAVRRAVEN